MPAPTTFLKGSVGFGGKNQSTDVKLVQQMLNAVPSARGGAFPALAPDGVCGPLTNGAIRKFQGANQCPTDGRMDVGGTTEKTIIAVLDGLGKLAALLGAAASAASAGPGSAASGLPGAPGGPNSPVRRRYVTTARSLVPAEGLTVGGTGPAGKTGCGEFPGRVFTRLPVILPGMPGAFKVQVAGAGYIYLTSPTTWWEEFAKAIDKEHAPAKPCWVPFTGANRPMQGDIYLLGMYDKPAMFQHVGVIIDASGSSWTTCDAGQGNGWQSGLRTRTFETDGVITGEEGKKARLKGWVDLDNLYAVAQASFPPL
jgi:peptidoglycan hydrolase-like protein with peptidoglycan-binding domain